jgi:hypothetical protein
LIIPIFNEIEFLETVLKNVRALPIEKELILVDDYSTDGTREILKGEESKPDAKVFYHEKNQGKGAAIRTGLSHATGQVIIIQDADLEYDPNEIPSIIQPILDGKTKVCYGSRFMGHVEGMRLPNRIANWILAWLVGLWYGQSVTDEATCYKAFDRELAQSIPLECERFEFCPEITGKVLRLGEKIHEVPIKYQARTFEEGKKIGWRDFNQAVSVLWKYRKWKPEK